MKTKTGEVCNIHPAISDALLVLFSFCFHFVSVGFFKDYRYSGCFQWCDFAQIIYALWDSKSHL